MSSRIHDPSFIPATTFAKLFPIVPHLFLCSGVDVGLFDLIRGEGLLVMSDMWMWGDGLKGGFLRRVAFFVRKIWGGEIEA